MRKTTTTLTLIIFLTLMGKPGFSQVEQGGQPIALSETLSTPVSVDLPPFDVDSAFLADTSAGIYNRMAFPRAISVDLMAQGTWDTLSDNSRVCRIQIYSPIAHTLSFIYDTFWLPSGAQFFVYNGNDSTKYIGSFTNVNHKTNGNFITGFQHGDEMILEYHEPSGASAQGLVSINSLLHGFRGFLLGDPDPGTLYKSGSAPPFGTSMPCNIDINCPEGANYQRIKNSVVVIFDTSGCGCTGVLVNNDDLDREPYMLTAFHCVHGDEDVWQIYFQHESPECPAVTANQNPPTILGAQLQTGGVLIDVNDGGGDHALMLLTPSSPDGKIPLSYSPFFAGWSISSVPVDSTYTIHHPVGDVKKISFEYAQPSIWSLGGSDIGWTVIFYPNQASPLTGIVQGGSSGAPIFDPQDRIIGLHNGAFNDPDMCSFNTLNAKWSGLYFAWDELPDLKTFLAPNTPARTELHGLNPLCNCGDVDAGGDVNIGDALYLVKYVFEDGPEPQPLESGDVDGGGDVNIGDALYIVKFVFEDGPEPDCSDQSCLFRPFGGGAPKSASSLGDPFASAEFKSVSDIELRIEKTQDGKYLVKLATVRNIDALDITFRSDYKDVIIEPLVNVPMFSSTLGNFIHVGLIDVYNRLIITPNDTLLFSSTRPLEIVSVRSCSIDPDGRILKQAPVIREMTSESSGSYVFDQNHPNPFNPETNFSFYMPVEARAKIEIYNILGQKVITLGDVVFKAGRHTLRWNSRDENGSVVASGIYFSRFISGDFESRKKMVILK